MQNAPKTLECTLHTLDPSFKTQLDMFFRTIDPENIANLGFADESKPDY
jgi:hypothetical protein